ncbi:hypothetical protein ASZ90_004446 [hydrocarbon metagenome]|uniref:Outer membrane protein beta-barrel domain-containing protein n=1 Tax=hydrocarbon metagenome TaxID=938273 RepID=A0A0W8FXW8_9ZZZZ
MRKFIWVFFLFIVTNKVFSQEINSANSVNEYELRNFFVTTNTGILEFISIGIGYQINDDISIALKYSGTWIGSSAMGLPNSAYGLGCKFSYHKPFLFFNSTSFEYISYLSSTLDWQSRENEPFLKGHYFDLHIGKENIEKNGFNFFWSLGICLSAAKEAHILVSPSLKGGVNFNL